MIQVIIYSIIAIALMPFILILSTIGFIANKIADGIMYLIKCMDKDIQKREKA